MILLQIFFMRMGKSPKLSDGVLLFALCLIILIEPYKLKGSIIYNSRNYYGISRVWDQGELRRFVHGTTIHGMQFRDRQRELTPISYYAEDSPLGGVLQSPLFAFRQVASLGLGAGAFTAYLQKGEEVDSFELDPEILYIAETYFSFLKNTGARVKHIIGDARIELDKIPSRKYDLLVVDTFSGDSIPAHLLTQEAVRGYQKHIKPDGLVILHLSNRFINCQPLVYRTGFLLKAKVCYKKGSGDGERTFNSDWAALTWDDKVYRKLTTVLGWEPVDEKEFQHIRVWTDQYSTILPYLRLKDYLRKLFPAS